MNEARVQAISIDDLKTLRLPERLHALYPLLRLPLWLYRRVRTVIPA